MPTFKAVRYFVFSEGDMIKTTTLKVKRRDESEQIHAKLSAAGMSMKSANGKNLDTL